MCHTQESHLFMYCLLSIDCRLCLSGHFGVSTLECKSGAIYPARGITKLSSQSNTFGLEAAHKNFKIHLDSSFIFCHNVLYIKQWGTAFQIIIF